MTDAANALAIGREIDGLDRAYTALRGFTTNRLEGESIVVIGELMLNQGMARGVRSTPDITLSAANAVPIIAGLMIAVQAERSLLIAKLSEKGFEYQEPARGGVASATVNLKAGNGESGSFEVRREAEGGDQTRTAFLDGRV